MHPHRWPQHAARRRQDPPWRLLGVRGAPGPVWWKAAKAHHRLDTLRADARANALAVAWQLALGARPDGSSAPTWERLCATTGLSRATVARWLRWWRDTGAVEVLQTGSTPATRGGQQPTEGNFAAVYCLVRPRRRNETPTGSPVGRDPYAREENCVAPTPAAITERSTAQPDHHAGDPAPWPRRRPASTKEDQRNLAATLRRMSRDLRSLSDRHVASILRPWLSRGWTLADVCWALDHLPDGTRRRHSTAVKLPARWLAARMRPWTDAPGPITDGARAAHLQRVRDAEARLAARQAAEQAAVPAPAWFTELRRRTVGGGLTRSTAWERSGP